MSYSVTVVSDWLDMGSNQRNVGVFETVYSVSRITHSRDGRFGSKVGKIGPKWDKSRAFSDQISVHLAPLE